jgi:hypothetical protein
VILGALIFDSRLILRFFTCGILGLDFSFSSHGSRQVVSYVVRINYHKILIIKTHMIHFSPSSMLDSPRNCSLSWDCLCLVSVTYLMLEYAKCKCNDLSVMSAISDVQKR